MIDEKLGPQLGIIPVHEGEALYRGHLVKARSEKQILKLLQAGTDWDY